VIRREKGEEPGTSREESSERQRKRFTTLAGRKRAFAQRSICHHRIEKRGRALKKWASKAFSDPAENEKKN